MNVRKILLRQVAITPKWPKTIFYCDISQYPHLLRIVAIKLCMCFSTLTYRQLYSEVANVNVAFFHQVSPDLLQVENGTCQIGIAGELCKPV